MLMQIHKNWKLFKFFLLGMIKNGCLLTVSQEWTDGINCFFFPCWYKFTQIKRWLKIFGGEHVQKWLWPNWWQDSKLTVSGEWTDGINWFFACWYKFTKIKAWSKKFWVGMVENGCASLVMGLWNWLYLKNELME